MGCDCGFVGIDGRAQERVTNCIVQNPVKASLEDEREMSVMKSARNGVCG